MRKLTLFTAVSVLSLISLAGIVQAQTAMPPIPESKVKQTKAHTEGTYTEMNRRQLQGGEIQEAWDTVQETDGVFKHAWCLDCTFRVRLRQHMITVVRLPKGETITQVDVGDQKNFPVKVRSKDTIAIKPLGFGGDTNMIVYGENNRIYPFYLRVESVNSDKISDQIFAIDGQVAEEIEIPDFDKKRDKKTGKPSPEELAEATKDLQSGGYLKTDKSDFVEHVPFDPDKLYGWGQFKLWGADELEPITVYRDDIFTYIKYGERWNGLELPTAYKVVDDIDELIDTHVKGTTYVIEDTAKLITLKSGNKFLCIEFKG